MNTKVVWIVTLILVVLGIGILWYVVSRPETAPAEPSEPGTSFPVSGGVAPVTTSSSTQSSGGMPLMLQDGSTVVANDFVHNGTTIPDEANQGQYLLAGNLGYCPTNPEKCQAASAANYTVYYDSTHQSFTMALTQEPIGQARLDLEQFLLKTLGLSQQQMCGLNYYVGTPYWVNERYDDRNLGFSFCSGAVKLPTK